MSTSVLPWAPALVGPLGIGSCVFLEREGWHSVSMQRNQGRRGQSAMLLAKLGTLSLEEGTGVRIPHVVLESAGGSPLGRLRQRHWVVVRCCHQPRPRWDLHAGNSSPFPPGGGLGCSEGVQTGRPWRGWVTPKPRVKSVRRRAAAPVARLGACGRPRADACAVGAAGPALPAASLLPGATTVLPKPLKKLCSQVE